MIARRRGAETSTAIAGFVAVAGNIGGVAALGELPSSYRLARLDGWVDEVLAHPGLAAVSGAAFSVGLVALALWAFGAYGASRRASARMGAQVIASGALLNAAGTLSTVVVGYHLRGPDEGGRAVARALLGGSLTLDAAFNVSLGVGLILVAAGWSAKDGSRWLRALAGVAGLASMPVGAQAVYDPAAKWLAVAGPLWLLFIAASSVASLQRRRRAASHVPRVAHAASSRGVEA